MISLIYLALQKSRTVVMLTVLILTSGLVSYLFIPRESSPNVTVPYINVIMHHDGISPEDADRLLVRPVYKYLKSIEGLKEVTSAGATGRAYLTLEFDSNTDIDKALLEVREQVNTAKTELPEDTDEPSVKEINIALQPIISVALSADNLDERILVRISRNLKDQIESVNGVLTADVRGDRQESVEILVDPHLLESYNISQGTLFDLVSRNNRLVAAGVLETEHGRFAVKVPGLFESVEDILGLPIKRNGDYVVTLGDIATVHRTFKEATSITRLNGQPMISLDTSKRIGSNIIEIADGIKGSVLMGQEAWPKGIRFDFLQDESQRIRDLLNDLENSVIFSTLLVMIVIIATLGIKSGFLVGLAIPGSFLIGILCLSLNEMTLNMVVLFSLILAVGMLVDATIVVVEYADRRIREGASKRNAFAEASLRMALPITASTATTLAVFAPLLFWPGIMGQFMGYLPITLIFTLTASLLMAMIVVPTLGSLGDKTPLNLNLNNFETMKPPKLKDFENINPFTVYYLEKLKLALAHPKRVILVTTGILIFSFFIYGIFGNGTVFFPKSEPEDGIIHVKARGELSLRERDKIVREVELKALKVKGIDQVYTTTYIRPPDRAAADVIGLIRLELSHWKSRPKAKYIFQELRDVTKDIPGVIIEVRSEDRGPAGGRDIELELASYDYEKLVNNVNIISERLKTYEGLVDVQDSRPPPGFEWEFKVDREEASQFGADLTDVGNTIKLVTNGIKLGHYRPDDSDDEVDILIRYPHESRNVDQFERLRISLGDRLVPISSFVEQTAVPKVSSVSRTDGRYAVTIEADVKEGFLANDIIQMLGPEIKPLLTDGVFASFRGNNEDQQETMVFLMKAFAVALFIMAIILVTQFNSFYQALLILSSVILSIAGVLIGLIFKGEPFSIVMSGVGIISLAGIVVNNNIVLIDTYNILKKQGVVPYEAALITGAQRLRPVLLTTITTILGLLPMVFEVNIKLMSQEIDFGAPSGQRWTQLATAIASGLSFATILTLIVTPCLLVLGEKESSITDHDSQEKPTQDPNSLATS